MFNYMLLVFGIFAAGVVNALDKELPPIALAGLCFSGTVLALIFIRLDARNRDLVWMGEAILVELEREVLFGENATIKGHRDKEKDQDINFGILLRQAKLPSYGRICSAWQGKHRALLPLVGFLIAGLFFAAGMWILCKKPQATGSMDYVQSMPRPVKDSLGTAV